MDWLKEAKLRENVLIKNITDIVSIPSLKDTSTAGGNAPFGLEIRKALDFFLDLGKRDGFKVTDVDGYAGIIEFGEGDEIVGILGHLDVVPPGDGWNKEPFNPVIDRGYLFGRGTMDDKGPTMIAYEAIKMLRDSGFKPSKRIFLIVGCDEESGMSCMEYYRKHAPIPNVGFTPDADFPLIYGEKGNASFRLESSQSTVIESFVGGSRPNVVIGQAKAVVNAKLKEEMFNFFLHTHDIEGEYKDLGDSVEYTIYGQLSHGAFPENGVNAGVHLLNFIGGAYNDNYASSLSRLLFDYYGKGVNIRHVGPHMGWTTMNVGIIKIEDGKQSITLDIRFADDYPYEKLKANLTARVAEENPNVEVVAFRHVDPLFVDPQSELITTLEASYRKYSNDYNTPLKTIGGGTYAKCFDNFVAFGPEFAHLPTPDFVGAIHSEDEAISLEHMVLSCAIYAEAILELAK